MAGFSVLETLVVRIMGNATHYNRTMHEVNSVTTRLTRSINGSLRSIGGSLTGIGTAATLAMAPVSAFLGYSVKEFARFDDMMHTSLALFDGMTSSVQKQMEMRIFEISADSRTAPIALANSYFHLASAGYSAVQSMEALGTVEKFMVAGAFDMSKSGGMATDSIYAMTRATNYLVDSMAALGLRSADPMKNMENMAHVGDVLSRANIIANGTVEEFADALTNKGAAALRLVNKDMEEGVAVLAAYASQGVKGAGAGEKLYIVLRDLQRAAIKNKDVWDDFGLSVYDAGGDMLPLVNIISQLENRFRGMSDEQKRIAVLQLGFQDRSLAATIQLLGLSKSIGYYEAELRKAGGTMEKVAGVRLKSFASQMMMLKNQIVGVAVGIGKLLAPLLLVLNNALRVVIDWWNKLNPTVQKWIVYIAAALAIIGPLIAGLGLLAVFASMVISGLSAVGAVIVPLLKVAAIIGVVAAAVMTLIYLVVGADGLSGAWNYVSKSVMNFVTNAIGFLENFSANIQILIQWLWTNWKTILQDMFMMWWTVLKNMVSNLQTILHTMMRLYATVFGWIVGQFERNFDTEFGRWVAKGIKSAIGMIVDFAGKAKDALASIWTGEAVDISGFLDGLIKDVEAGAAGESLTDLGLRMQEIIKEQLGKMKTPLAGMEFKTRGPDFLLGIKPGEAAQEAFKPFEGAIRGVEDAVDDARDAMEDPLTLDLETKGLDKLEAVEIHTAEAMGRWMEYMALRGKEAAPKPELPDLAAGPFVEGVTLADKKKDLGARGADVLKMMDEAAGATRFADPDQLIKIESALNGLLIETKKANEREGKKKSIIVEPARLSDVDTTA